MAKKGKFILLGGGAMTVPIAFLLALVIMFLMAATGDEEAEAAELAYSKQCKETGKATGITFGGQMDIILKTLRIHESNENYTDPPNDKAGKGASGAYQFLRSSWNLKLSKDVWSQHGDFAAGAYTAPPNVQDLVAKAWVEYYIVKSSIDLLGVQWFLGKIPKGAEWDQVPSGNVITPREYQRRWMKLYNFLLGEKDANTSPDAGTISPDAAERNSTYKSKANPEDVVAVGDIYRGPASTYGDDTITGYVDLGDRNPDGTPMLPAIGYGITNATPGVAVYNQGTLGGWWLVTGPNGKSGILQQTDYGPSTSRMIDINAVAARHVFGYPAATFPTDQGIWTAKYLGKDVPLNAIKVDTGGTGDAPDITVVVEKPLECNSAEVGSDDGEMVPDAKVPIGPVAASDMVNIQGIFIHKDIAGNLDRMLTAMKAEGLKPGGGGYRSPESQIAVRKKNCGSSYDAIYNKPSSSCSPPTAKPGKSMHEKGMAIDFTCGGYKTFGGSPCWNWLKIHAAEYGFKPFSKEPWHWSTNGN